MSMIEKNTKFVGNLNFDTFLTVRNDAENEDELKEALYEMCSKSDLNDIYVYPNFEFQYIANASGFVASIPLDNVFHSDLMVTDKFRVIMAAEVKIDNLDSDLLYRAKRDIKKYFPIDSDCPPTLEDNQACGWHPALGRRGCSIGIYKTVEEDVVNAHKWDRYYIICHTSLPDATLNEMIYYDKKQTLDNMKLSYQYDFANIEATNQSYTYVKDAFSSESVNTRMLDIAIENARRLIVIYADILGLSFYEPVSHHVAADLPQETQKSDIIAERSSLLYRKTVGVESKLDDMLEIKEAIKLWEPGVPIEGFSKLPDDVPEKYRGYPLGNVLMMIYQNTPHVIQQLEKDFGITLRTFPRSIKENICCDYNTFRKEDNQLLWYSNCTPTSSASKGVIFSDGLENGFKVVNQNFMFPRRGQEFEEGMGFSNSGKQFMNMARNGYPVVWPFIHQPQRKIQDEALKTFFDIRESSKPSQLLGTQVINRDLMNEVSVKEDLKADFLREDCLKLTPVKVFLSSQPFDSPTYEMN